MVPSYVVAARTSARADALVREIAPDVEAIGSTPASERALTTASA
jgi:hypothetical protein